MAPPEHQSGDLSCPKCGSPRQPEALDCPFCGIIYDRFDPSRQPRAARPGDATPGRSDELAAPTPMIDESPWDEPAPGSVALADDPYAAQWSEASTASAGDGPVSPAGAGPAPRPAPRTRHELILERLEDLHIPILGGLILLHLTLAGLFSTHMVSADQSMLRASNHYRAATGKPLPQRLDQAVIFGFVGRTLVALSKEGGEVGVVIYTEGSLAGSREPEAVRADAHRILHQMAREAGLDWQVTRRAAGWLRGEKVEVEQLEPLNEAASGVVGYMVTAWTAHGHPTCVLIAGSKDAALDMAKEVLARD